MLPDFHHKNKAKCYRIFVMDIWYVYLVPLPSTLGKHRLRPHPFRNQSSKPNLFKSTKTNANSLFLIANVLKLRFYQNKGLSMDRHCRVPNTFPMRNLTSELKNQDLLFVLIRLGKTTFFLD